MLQVPAWCVGSIMSRNSIRCARLGQHAAMCFLSLSFSWNCFRHPRTSSRPNRTPPYPLDSFSLCQSNTLISALLASEGMTSNFLSSEVTMNTCRIVNKRVINAKEFSIKAKRDVNPRGSMRDAPLSIHHHLLSGVPNRICSSFRSRYDGPLDCPQGSGGCPK